MLHKEFWGLIFLGFVVWVFMAGDGTSRINRGCRPIHWVGNVVVSVTALVLPSQQEGVRHWSNKLEYGCRYTAWRLFYQDAYNEAMERMEGGDAAPSSPPPASGENPAPTPELP